MHLYDNPLGFEGFPAFMGFFSSNDFPKSDNIYKCNVQDIDHLERIVTGHSH